MTPPVLLLATLLTATAGAAPAAVTLKNIRHEHQALNNCGPVTAMTILGYYGTRITQAQAARALKDNSRDPQVSSLELAGYLGASGLNSVIRYAGNAELMRELLAAGFPVVVQQRLKAGSNVAHFRTLYGYSGGTFLVSDPLLGPSLRLSSAQLMDLWRYYNGEYMVAYPPQKAAQVRAILGEDFSASSNWQRLKRLEEQNVKSSPNDPYFWWGLGKANLRLGDAQEAARNFDRAVQIGVPIDYYLYRQEAFEAWNAAGQYSKTHAKAVAALRAFPGAKELLYFRDAASAALND